MVESSFPDTFGGLDPQNKPQVMELIKRSLAITIYDTKWIPLR